MRATKKQRAWDLRTRTGTRTGVEFTALTFPCSFNRDRVSEMPRAGATLREAMGEKDLRKETGLQEGRTREAPRDPRAGSREKEILGATAITARFGCVRVRGDGGFWRRGDRKGSRSRTVELEEGPTSCAFKGRIHASWLTPHVGPS